MKKLNLISKALALIGLMLVFNPGAAWALPPTNPEVSYLDENGATQTITEYTLINSNQTTAQSWSTGYYVVGKDYNKDGVINGDDATYAMEKDSATTFIISNKVMIGAGADAKLVLADGFTLNVTPGSSAAIYGYVSSNLTVYAQSMGDGAGALNATGGTDNEGIYIGANLTINGGKITGKGGDSNLSAKTGIYAGTNITINGGTVNAIGGNGTSGGSGLQADTKVTINGGMVTATGGTGSNGYGGYGLNSKTTAINGGMVTATGGTGSSGNFDGFYCRKDNGNTVTVSADLTVKAGTDSADTEIKHTSAQNIVSSLYGNRYVTVTVPTYTLTGASATAGGGVTFTVGGATVTEAAKGATVTVAGVAVEGHYVTGFTSAQVTITDSTFTMPADSVTVTAIYAQYDNRIVVTNTYTKESPYTLTTGKTYTAAPAEQSSGIDYGGAVYVKADGNLTGENVTFADNSMHYAGIGGAFCNEGGTTLTNATFISNSAVSTCGAFINYSTATFNGSTTFKDNFTKDIGGAFANYSTATFNAGATFDGNSATKGGAIYNNSGTLNFAGTMDLKTETDTWANEGSYSQGTETSATVNWDLTKVTDPAQSTVLIKGFQYYSNKKTEVSGVQKLLVNQTITVNENQKSGSYVIATGDKTGYEADTTAKYKFYLHYDGAQGDSIIKVGDEKIEYGKNVYSLAIDTNGMAAPTDDKLVLTVKSKLSAEVDSVCVGKWFNKSYDEITITGTYDGEDITSFTFNGNNVTKDTNVKTWSYTFASHADTDSTQYIIKVTDGDGNSDSVYYTLRVDTEVPGLGDITVVSGASLADSIHGYSGQWITDSLISVILPANDSTSGVQGIDSVYYDGQKLGSGLSFSDYTLVIDPQDYSDIKGGELKVYLTDKAGNSTDTTIVLNIDTKAPVVETGEFIGESMYVNTDGTIWYRQGDATAAYKTVITDATSGLKSATFLDSLYNAQDSLFAIPVAKEDSIRGLKYITAVDTAGNQGSITIDTLIGIDGSVPMITIGKTITATDDLSGFDKMFYVFEDGAKHDTVVYYDSFDIKKAGAFKFHAVDKVGNDTVLDMTASEDLTNVMYDGTIIYAKPDANGRVEIQNGAKVLISQLLKDSTDLKRVVIPSSVELIDSEAFSGCTALDSAWIGTGLDSIGAEAFAYCNGLKFMKVEAVNPAKLGADVWKNLAVRTVRMDVPAGSICSYIHTEQWKDRLYYIFYNGIWYDITDKEEQTPKYVKIISTQDATIYKDAIEIPESFEYGHLNLAPIEVGDTAFAGCAVTDIILPSGVTKIDSAAFAGCTELDNLELRAMKVAEFHETAFDEDSEIMYYVPAEFNELYKSDLNWKPVNDRISHLVTVTEAGYATLYTYDRVIAESDIVETFIPTTAGSAGNLFIDLGTAIQKGTVLPGQNGMIIKAPKGIYRYTVSTSAAGTDKQSSLDGVILDRPFSYSDYNGKVFTLSTKDGETTFYRFKGKTLSAGHAFLNIQTGQQSIPFGQGTTGIKAVNALENADIYNLSGLKVEHITEPGLYIVNGVKTYVK